MRNRFRYTPLRPLNNLVYAVVWVAALGGIELWGAQIWAAVLGRFGGPATFVGLGFGFYLGWFWLLAAGYALLDHHKHPAFLYRHKIQQRPPGKDRPGPPMAKAVRVVLRNQLLGTLPALALVYQLMLWRGMDLDAAPPAWWINALHLAGLSLIAEVVFYGAHRFLHWKPMFRRFHRVHHEARESFHIATHYVHYVEQIVGNLPTFFVGVVILNPHPLVIFVWIWLVVTNAIHTHAGYNFPWMSWAVDHDFHHWNVRGNYGSLGILDWVFGTDAPMRALAEEQREGGG